MMYHIPGVLSPQDVARFREQLEQAEWVSVEALSDTERGEGGFGHTGK